MSGALRGPFKRKIELAAQPSGPNLEEIKATSSRELAPPAMVTGVEISGRMDSILAIS